MADTIVPADGMRKTPLWAIFGGTEVRRLRVIDRMGNC